MSLVIVQTVGQGNGSTSIALGSNITVGNTAFLVFGQYDGQPYTVTQVTVGGTSVPYRILAFPQTGSGGSTDQGFAIIMIPNIQVSGSATIGWTYTGSNIIASWACEISGFGVSPVLDQISTGTGQNNTIASGTTGATTSANQFILGGGATYNGTSSAPSQTWANSDLGINSHLSVGWEIQTTGGQTYGWTQATAGSEGWGAAVVTVKIAPPGLLMAGIV
jgi:hypothetical protein